MVHVLNSAGFVQLWINNNHLSNLFYHYFDLIIILLSCGDKIYTNGK